MSGLLNFLQGASNAAASNVSAPVDGLAWLLKKAGVNVGTPIGGSDWMRAKGLTADAPGIGGLLGESVGGVLPMIAAAKAPQIASGLLKVGENAAARPMLNPQTGAIVWHGSPHKFDKFDSSKIGTGEGKQQQGIGAYLAEVQAVGQKYADKEAWKRGQDAGYLYKVDMPDSLIASMANHDAPLSSQPKSVINAVTEMMTPDARKALKNYHGWDRAEDAPFAAVLDSLEVANGNNREATVSALRKAGIPGIRYLDGGSRGAGAGSSNFVVFPGEESALTILERNGGLLNQTAAKKVAAAPRAKDLVIAQKNAAKPISEGGLGLRPDNTPMERAQAMGFDTEVFHGTRTPEPIKEFIPGGAAGSVRSGDAYGVGTYTSTDPLTASSKAYTGEDGAVMPLLLNRKNHLDLEAPSQAQLDRVGSFMADQMLPADKARFPQNIKQAMFSADDVSSAKDFFRNQQANAEQFGGGYERTQPWIDKSTDGRFVIHYTDFDAPVSLKTGGDVETALRGVGYDSVPLMGFDGHTMRRNIGEQWDVTTNPARLRSRFAAFDPFKKDSADLLASIGGMGLLSPFLFDRNKSTD